MPSEYTRLLEKTPTLLEKFQEKIAHLLHTLNSNKKTVTKVASNAISTSAQAISTTFNAKQFTAFGESYVATETTTSQSLGRNVPGGALLAIGQYLADLLGRVDLNNLTDEQRQKLRDIMIAGYTLCGIYTLVSNVAFGGCIAAYNDEDTTNYLLLSGAASWPTLALGFLGPVVFSHDNWIAAMLSAILSRGASIAGSYLFSSETPEGVLGISLGNGIGPWLIYIPFEIWMRRAENLQHLRFQKLPHEADMSWPAIITNACKTYLGPLTTLSLKIGSQRAAEWVNLWVVAKVIGAMSKDNLTAAEPSTQLLSVLNLFSQGIGIALNLILKTHISKLNSADTPPEEKERLYKKIKAISFYGLLIPTILYAGISVGIYFWRTAVVAAFLTPDEIAKNPTFPETLTWLSGTSLPVDAIRLITSGALNAFGQMVTQNTWSLLLMTAFGVPVSLLSLFNPDNEFRVETVFAVRSLMILIAGGINLQMLWSAIAACNPNKPGPATSDNASPTRQQAQLLWQAAQTSSTDSNEREKPFVVNVEEEKRLSGSFVA